MTYKILFINQLYMSIDEVRLDIRGILVILEVHRYFTHFRDFGDNFGCPKGYWKFWKCRDICVILGI